KFVKKQAHAHKAHEALLKEKNADSVKKQAILDKLKEGTALSAGERSFIEGVRKKVNNSDNLCAEVDFHPGDDHCIRCDNDPDCFIREVDQYP
ncbi:MAG: hypothetical protein GY754_43690, partial [bacterium]|nr:hypothetical protein [bacterium]